MFQSLIASLEPVHIHICTYILNIVYFLYCCQERAEVAFKTFVNNQDNIESDLNRYQGNITDLPKFDF